MHMKPIKIIVPDLLHKHMKIQSARKGITVSMAYEQAMEEWLKVSVGYYKGGRNEDERPKE